MRRSRLLERAWLLFLCLLAPSLAQAHPGAFGHTHGFANGLMHPLTGLDHVCAMLAVGLWAAQRGGRALWLLPLTFVLLMTVGGVFGVFGVPVRWVEAGIALSVLVFGLVIASAMPLRLRTSVALVGGFALFHGYAHGAEMPETVSGLAYGGGFVAATLGLHLLGVGIGWLSKTLGSAQWVRIAGGAVMVCGIYLCFSL